MNTFAKRIFGMLILLATVIALPVGADPSPTVSAHRVAAVGEQAPGFEPGAVIEQFAERARIDEQGNVAFAALVRRADGSSTQAIFRNRGGVNERLFADGDRAPGTTASFVALPVLPQTPHIHAGRVSFDGSIDGANGIRAGVWTDRSGSFVPLFVIGEPGLDALPALPAGARMVDFRRTMRGDTVLLSGRFAVTSSIVNENNGLWRNSDGIWQAVVVKGQPAPGLPGAVFDGDTPGGGTVFFHTADSTGRVLAQAWADGSGISDDNDEGLWIEGPNGLTLLVREGDPAPVAFASTGKGGGNGGKPGKGGKGKGGGGAPTFGPQPAFPPTFGADGENLTPDINDRGHVIFGAVLRSREGRSNSVWTNRAGAIESVALGSLGLDGSGPATQAPGFPNGVLFAAFRFGQINADDVIAFQGWALESSVTNLTPAIWWDGPGALSLAAGVNQPVPPVAGAVYAELELEDLTDANTLLVHARLAGNGIDAANDRVLLQVDRAGTTLALRDGSTVIADGNARVLASFVPGTGLTASGDGVAELRFTDQGSGIYVFPRIR